MTPQTRFRMASHSKLFTATAVMQLREQGESSRLDDPVSKLPAVVHGQTRRRATTRRSPSRNCSRTAPVCRAKRARTGRRSSFPPPTSCASCCPRARRHSRRRSAGSTRTWRYSVAGMIVEAVSGQKWADYVQREIFQPLGMNASSVDKNVSGLAVGYGRPDARRHARDQPVHRRARDGRGHRRHLDRRGHGEVRVGAVSRRAARGGARFSSTGSLREMHRVRVLENNWTQGNAIGFRRAQGRRQGLRLARRQLSRLSDEHDAVARREGRASSCSRTPTMGTRRRHGDRVDEHRRARRWRKRRRRSRRPAPTVGPVVVALRRPVPRAAAAIRASSN